MPRLLRINKGLTLIEMVVTLAIVGIVISLVFSVHLFGSKITDKGSTQSDVQNDVRLVAEYITSQLRIANSVEILSANPGTLDNQKKYFYVDGNTIKYYSLGTVMNLLQETAATFVPVLEFKKNTSNLKVLNFFIKITYKGQSFQTESEVLAQNIDSTGTINGPLSGIAIVFSCPLTNKEIVTADKAKLEIRDTNPWLAAQADGSWTLNPPPDPNVLNLPSTGFNGSSITWSSSDISVINNNGTVLRPGINAGNRYVELTATLTKGTSPNQFTTTKMFRINVSDLDPLVLGNTTTSPGSIGSPYEHVFTASGGDAAYTFSALSALPSGFTLESGGRLWAASPGVTSFSFDLSVQDGFTPPNVTSQSGISVTVN